jgi:hypothetical protein
MAKKEELDEETLALIHWCIEVEHHLVASAGVSRLTSARSAANSLPPIPQPS